MRYWLCSDTHFGHDKMKEYCYRPDGFEYKIQKSFEQIKPKDVLIHLGDVCIGNDEKWHEMMIKYLPCKKWLIRGNHDHKSYNWYLEHGWDFVADSMSMVYSGKKILFTHIPTLYDKARYDLNIHGHLHNNRHRGSIEDFGFADRIYKLISLEFSNYQIINLIKIL